MEKFNNFGGRALDQSKKPECQEPNFTCMKLLRQWHCQQQVLCLVVCSRNVLSNHVMAGADSSICIFKLETSPRLCRSHRIFLQRFAQDVQERLGVAQQFRHELNDLHDIVRHPGQPRARIAVHEAAACEPLDR